MTFSPCASSNDFSPEVITRLLDTPVEKHFYVLKTPHQQFSLCMFYFILVYGELLYLLVSCIETMPVVRFGSA